MTPFDRVNNQKQYDELLSGFYADDDAAGLDLGHLSSTDYMLLGDITRTSTGFALQLTVNSNSDKKTVASYSQTVSIAELDNLTGVRRASLDLLQKMGVQVTERTRTELTGAATAERVNAQTAMAQGIVAQRQGNTVETMVRFYEAASYDSSLAEAATRANTLSATIRTGSVGDNIRNDIAWRDEWVKLINDTVAYFRAPSRRPVAAQVFYDDASLTYGETNYQTRSTTISFPVIIQGVRYPQAYFRIRSDLRAGLEQTGRNGQWRLGIPALDEIWQRESFTVMFEANLLDNTGKVISRTNSNQYMFYDDVTTTLMDSGGRPYGVSELKRATFTVRADDMTDQMTIRFSAQLDRSYPIEVYRMAEYRTLLANTGGLPTMPTDTMEITRSPDSRRPTKISLTVESPGNYIERMFGLSYRPGLADRNGFLFAVNSEFVINTTNYRFPVSVALISNAAWYSRTEIRKIINLESGSREPIKNHPDRGGITHILIVPRGWFNRNNIRVGDEISTRFISTPLRPNRL